MTPEEKEERERLFGHPLSTSGGDCIVSVPGDLVFPKHFADMAEDIYNMEVREDDVWMITYPKAGSTWTQVSSHCSRAGKKSTMIVKTIALVYEGRASFVCTP